MISPVWTSVITGPAPKSTWAASPGLKLSRNGTAGAARSGNWLTKRWTEA